MIISELNIHQLRNIAQTALKLNKKINLIYGSNGSGKTSILESLYLLSCGHSFRTRELSALIKHQENSLVVFARSHDEHSLSIQKSFNQLPQMKIDGQFCKSTSELAYKLPCLVIHSDIFQIIDSGPTERRSVLDWGMFHVKHSYLAILKEYKKVLKQRNALLKTFHAPEHFAPWDDQLATLAEQVNNLRSAYFTTLENEFQLVLKELCTLDCKISYYKGWDKKEQNKDLKSILTECLESDRHRGYTQFGAHQADIIIENQESKAKNVLSRGQQKIILTALKFAQANLLDKKVLFLIDDLPSELDETYQKQILKYLAHSENQFVVTATHKLQFVNECFKLEDIEFFELKDGSIVKDVSRET